MRLSISARLTLWYAAVVVVALATGAVAVAQVQTRLARNRLDAELGRLEMTVAAVLHNEFGEGLDLAGAAREASTEVVAPGRTIVVTTPDGAWVRQWGDAVPVSWPRPELDGGDMPETIEVQQAGFRLVRTVVADGPHTFGLAVLAPMSALAQERSELLRTLALGVLVALGVALVGGWLFGRRALRPLSDMARQAVAVTEREPAGRLRAPNPSDELGRLASAFNALLGRLSSALLSQREFMADASHQLRTPISIIRTTAQVTLGRTARSEDEYRESIGVIGEQSARLAKLVDAMFLLSRADAGGRPVRAEPIYVDELVAECVRGMSVMAEARRIALRVEIARDVAMSGDEALLREMVSNILDNAVRYSRQGGVVWTRLARSPGGVILDVEDEGPGIAPADQARIFDRFVQVRTGADGAGLGLPIARWIATAHGGALVLESSGPSGSRFRITLPLTPSAEAIGADQAIA